MRRLVAETGSLVEPRRPAYGRGTESRLHRLLVSGRGDVTGRAALLAFVIGMCTLCILVGVMLAT